MAVMPLVPETKMADVGKLISLGNLLVKKVTWLVLTTTSVTLIFVPRIWSRLHDKDCLYILLFSKNSFFSIVTSRNSTVSLSHCDLINTLSYIATSEDNSLSLSHTHILTSSSQPHENVYIL